jgi:hypothetical protein
VEVVWSTSRPYESVVEAIAEGACLSGITLRHSSKSVANNYAVFVRVSPSVPASRQLHAPTSMPAPMPAPCSRARSRQTLVLMTSYDVLGGWCPGCNQLRPHSKPLLPAAVPLACFPVV